MVGRVGEIEYSSSSTWVAVEIMRSSVTIDGISGLLPLSILKWVEGRRGRTSHQGQMNERVREEEDGGREGLIETGDI